jgi:hypothetical protein
VAKSTTAIGYNPVSISTQSFHQRTAHQWLKTGLALIIQVLGATLLFLRQSKEDFRSAAANRLL